MEIDWRKKFNQNIKQQFMTIAHHETQSPSQSHHNFPFSKYCQRKKKKNTKNNVMNCSSMPCPTLYHNKAWNWLIYTRNKMLLKIDCAINNWCIILCFLNTIKRIAHNVALFLNIIKFTQLLFTMWTWCV